MLWWSPLQIHDMGGLCDRELAKAADPSTRRKILLARKPDLVALHGFFAGLYQLGDDADFRTDYVSLFASSSKAQQTPVLEGLFLRRNLLPEGMDPLTLGQVYLGR